MVRSWRETIMAVQSPHVCCRGQSGKHLLGMRISHVDPKRTPLRERNAPRRPLGQTLPRLCPVRLSPLRGQLSNLARASLGNRSSIARKFVVPHPTQTQPRLVPNGAVDSNADDSRAKVWTPFYSVILALRIDRILTGIGQTLPPKNTFQTRIHRAACRYRNARQRHYFAKQILHGTRAASKLLVSDMRTE
jgi:hypothetical protein